MYAKCIHLHHFFAGDHSTGVWVGGSDNGHVGKWAWFPTGEFFSTVRRYNFIYVADWQITTYQGMTRNHCNFHKVKCRMYLKPI
jgi:hypothetical protein